jgi:outer membrane lipoprotein SlyB
MLKNSTLKTIAVALIGISLIAGCSNNSRPSYYSTTDSRQAQTVRLGTVVSVHEVNIHNEANPIFTAAGAGLGGVAGNSVGGGRGKTIMTIVGAIAGGAAAHYGQKAINQKGYDITVRLDNGDNLLTIVQAAEVEIIKGQRVRVVSGSNGDRVLPL